MTKLITINKKDNIACVTINNPPMNVLSKTVTNELYKTFLHLQEDDEVVSIILTGQGERAFMAGADIKEFPMKINQRENTGLITGHQLFNFIEKIPKPTIAMLNGYTLGGGLELALCCDLRIAEVHVKIGLPEINLGLFPGGGGTQRLPRLIGEARAKELMFTGEAISAQTAHAYGIVNEVVPTGKGMERAAELANNFAQKSLQAFRRIKQAIHEGLNLSLEEGLKLEEKLFEEIFQTEDAKEGIRAFIDKRKPVFKHV